MEGYKNFLTFEEGIDYDLMKRRLTHNGKRVYIKSLTPTYALVSYNEEASEKLFKVKVKNIKTIKIKGKNKVFKGTKGKRADYKKAIICLNKGESLDYSGGIS